MDETLDPFDDSSSLVSIGADSVTGGGPSEERCIYWVLLGLVETEHTNNTDVSGPRRSSRLEIKFRAPVSQSASTAVGVD